MGTVYSNVFADVSYKSFLNISEVLRKEFTSAFLAGYQNYAEIASRSTGSIIGMSAFFSNYLEGHEDDEPAFIRNSLERILTVPPRIADPGSFGLALLENVPHGRAGAPPLLIVNWPVFLSTLRSRLSNYTSYEPPPTIAHRIDLDDLLLLPLSLWAFIEPVLHAYSPHLQTVVEQEVFDVLASKFPMFACQRVGGRPSKVCLTKATPDYTLPKFHHTEDIRIDKYERFFLETRIIEMLSSNLYDIQTLTHTAFPLNDALGRVVASDTYGVSAESIRSLLPTSCSGTCTVLSMNSNNLHRTTPDYPPVPVTQRYWIPRSRGLLQRYCMNALSIPDVSNINIPGVIDRTRNPGVFKATGVTVIQAPDDIGTRYADEYGDTVVMSMYHLNNYLCRCAWRNSLGSRPVSFPHIDSVSSVLGDHPNKLFSGGFPPLDIEGTSIPSHLFAKYLRALAKAITSEIPARCFRKYIDDGYLPVLDAAIMRIHPKVSSMFPASIRSLVDACPEQYYVAIPRRFIDEYKKQLNQAFYSRMRNFTSKYEKGYSPLDGTGVEDRAKFGLRKGNTTGNTRGGCRTFRYLSTSNSKMHPIMAEQVFSDSVDFTFNYSVRDHHLYLEMPPSIRILKGTYYYGDSSNKRGSMREGIVYSKSRMSYFINFWLYAHAVYKYYLQACAKLDRVPVDLDYRALAILYRLPDAESVTSAHAQTEFANFLIDVDTFDMLARLAAKSNVRSASSNMRTELDNTFLSEWISENPDTDSRWVKVKEPAAHSWTKPQDDCLLALYRPKMSEADRNAIAQCCFNHSWDAIRMRAKLLLKRKVVQEHVFFYDRLPHAHYSSKVKKWIAEEQKKYEARTIKPS